MRNTRTIGHSRRRNSTPGPDTTAASRLGQTPSANVVLVVAAVALTVVAAFALWPVDSYGDGLIYDLKWRADMAVQDVVQRFSAAMQN